METVSTLTVYSDTADGGIRSDDATYATARSGSSFTLNAGEVSFGIQVGQYFDGATYQLFETFFSFDTSSLGTGAIISAATFSLYGASDDTTTDFTMEARLRDWGATLETSDWVAGASLSGLTSLATFATSGFSIAGYNDFTDVALPANVNKTGSTRMIVVSSLLTAGTTPTTTGERLRVWTADQAGTTTDPKLVVTYTGDATVTPAAIAATASFPAASPSGDANVTPAPISASATFPAVGLDVSAGPQPIACVAAFPQASLFFDYVVTPATLSAVAAFPQAGVDVSVGASVLAALASFPSAGVSVSVGPSAIAVTASFPAATVTAIFSDIGFAVSVVTSVGKSTTSFTSRAGATSTVSSAGSSEAEVLP